MTTLLEPSIVRAAGKPPPNSFEDARPAADEDEAVEDEGEDEE